MFLCYGMSLQHFVGWFMRLRNIRRSQRVTQQQLAEATGIDQAAISRIENGKQEVKLGDLRLMAKALKVLLAELVGDDPMDNAA